MLEAHLRTLTESEKIVELCAKFSYNIEISRANRIRNEKASRGQDQRNRQLTATSRKTA